MSSAILPLESPTAQQPCSIRGSHQHSPGHHRLEVLSEHDVPRFSGRPSVAVNAQLGIAIALRTAPVTARRIGLDLVLGPRVLLLLPPIQPFLKPIDLNPRVASRIVRARRSSTPSPSFSRPRSMRSSISAPSLEHAVGGRVIRARPEQSARFDRFRCPLRLSVQNKRT